MDTSGYDVVLSKLGNLESGTDPLTPGAVKELFGLRYEASQKAWDSFDQHRDGAGAFFGIWEGKVLDRIKSLDAKLSKQA